MAMTMDVVKVKRGKLYSCDEAGKALGIATQLVRLWIRMRLLHAERVGRTYVIYGEQLALTSKRYYEDYYTDAPCGRNSSVNHIELE